MSTPEIIIEPAVTDQQKMEFIKFPLWLYRKHLKDPYWVPPLISERKAFLNPDKNPFFEHSEAEFFVARRDGQVPALAPLRVESDGEEVTVVLRGMESDEERLREAVEVATALAAEAGKGPYR